MCSRRVYIFSGYLFSFLRKGNILRCVRLTHWLCECGACSACMLSSIVEGERKLFRLVRTMYGTATSYSLINDNQEAIFIKYDYGIRDARRNKCRKKYVVFNQLIACRVRTVWHGAICANNYLHYCHLMAALQRHLDYSRIRIVLLDNSETAAIATALPT